MSSPTRILDIVFIKFDLFQFSIQLERLKTSSIESKKRQKLLQTQMRTLLDEKADLLVQVQDQNREITVLRRSLGFGGEEQIDLMKASSVVGCSQLSGEDLKPLLLERDSLREKVKMLENELKQYKADTKSDDEQLEVLEGPSDENPMIKSV